MERLLKNSQVYRMLASKKGRLKHAYLLLFPDAKYLRTALKTFAPLFFDDVLGDSSSKEKARRLSLIEKECYSDCLFFPEEGKKFTVDCAERVEEECTLRPVEENKKLFVIGDFSEATKEAQNKLLKLLEEPPESVCFLLGATSSFSVLPTVLSRVEKLEIPPFSESCIVEFLQRNLPDISLNDATVCAKSSGGVAGKAYDMASGEYFHTLLQTARTLCFCNTADLPALVKNCGDTKYKKELLSLLKISYFDALLYHAAKAEKRSDFSKDTARLAENYSYASLLKIQEIFTQAEKQLYFNGSFPQILEISLDKIIALRQ